MWGGGDEEEKPTNVATRKNKTSDGRVLPAGGAKLLSEEGGRWGELRWTWRPPSGDAPRHSSGQWLERLQWCKLQEWERHLEAATGHRGEWLDMFLILWNLGSFVCQLLLQFYWHDKHFFISFFLTIPNENVQRTGKQKTKQMLRFPKTKKKCLSTDVITLVTVRNAYFVSPPLVWTASGPAVAGLVAFRHFYTHVEWKLAELLRYRLVLKWWRHYWGEHHAALASV